MYSRLTTRERILETSLRLFNEQGYSATSLTRIATEVGIAKGNLTYYFATKQALALELEHRARVQAVERRKSGSSGLLFADAYVQTIWFGLSDWWSYRFLYRDHAQYQDNSLRQLPNQPMIDDIQKIHASLKRMETESMLRSGYVPDLQVLARTLFMVTRFWLDHLRETEGPIQFSAEVQRRGLEHHFAVLLPNLTAEARRQFEAALDRLSAGSGIEASAIMRAQ